MKKFLRFMLMAVVTLMTTSLSAQDFYVVGDVVGHIGETKAEACKMEYDEDQDTYTIKGVQITAEEGVGNGYVKFYLYEEDSDEPTIYGGEDIYDYGYANVYSLSMAMETDGVPFKVSKTGTYDITIEEDWGDLTVLIEESAAPGEEKITALYAVGPFNDWNYAEPKSFTLNKYSEKFKAFIDIDADGIMISTKKGDEATFKSGAYKIKDDAKLTDDEEAELEAGEGLIYAAWKGEYEIYVTQDMKTIEAYTDDPDPSKPVEVSSYSPAAGDYLSLKTISVWFPYYNEVSSVDEANKPYLLNGEEKIYFETIEPLSRQLRLTLAEEIKTAGTYVLTLPEGSVTFEHGAKNAAATCEYKVVEIPADLIVYVQGEIQDNIDTPKLESARMKNNGDGTFTLNSITLYGDEDYYSGDFHFEAYQADNETFFGKFGAQGSTAYPEMNVAEEVFFNGTKSFRMDISEPKDYSIKLDLNAMTVTVGKKKEKTTGIKSLGTSTTTRIYDLNGREVNSSAKGVLIKQLHQADGTIKTVKVVK